MSKESRQYVLIAEKDTPTHPHKSLGQLFFDALSSSVDGDKILLVSSETQQAYTKSEIFSKSVQIAKCLHELGIRDKDVIGLVFENTVEYMLTVLGCFYLGACLNPLNPSYIPQEIQYAFNISSPKFIITESDKAAKVIEATNNLETIPTIITFEDLQTNNAEFLPPPSALKPEEEIGLIMYSSGTTGLPKGVEITQYAVKHCLHHLRLPNGFAINSETTLLAVLPFYHIFGLMTVVACILYEAKAIVMKKFKPDIYTAAIETYNVTTLIIVPPLALFLAKTPLLFNAESVKDVICGAAPLGPEIQSALESKLGLAIRQVYGMTECGAISLGPMKGSPPGSSGCLLPNLSVVIRDLSTNVALPPGQTGELCFKSPCAMRGYMKNITANQEAFDKDGFLRTGDIAYYDKNGFIYIVDRLKELIKYKGFQISPAEIEDILISHEEIKDAAVIGIPDEKAGELTKAFIVKKEGSLLNEESVQEWVAKQVSFHKRLHGGVEFMLDIPKNAAGKVLRKKLRV